MTAWRARRNRRYKACPLKITMSSRVGDYFSACTDSAGRRNGSGFISTEMFREIWQGDPARWEGQDNSIKRGRGSLSVTKKLQRAFMKGTVIISPDKPDRLIPNFLRPANLFAITATEKIDITVDITLDTFFNFRY